MTRTTRLLVALGAILMLVVWYLFLWSPRVEALEAVEAEIQTVLASQAETRTRIGQLQLTREQAPGLQAELVAGESLIPRETALPGALRQLQQAADESGATLVSVAPGRPVAVEGGAPDLYSLALSLEVRGGYFQIVDTLRRLEDPTISPRGFVWDSVALTADEYPTLVVALSGQMFAVLPAPPADPGVAVDPAAPVAEGSETTDAAETTDAPPADDASNDVPPADEIAS